MKSFITFITFFIAQVLSAQDTSCTKTFALGNDSVRIEITKNDTVNIPVTYIHVHSDEKTALYAAQDFTAQNGGTFITISNDSSRFILFNYKNKIYKIDPNRIYTTVGRKTTLQKLSAYNISVAIALKSFADSILQHIDTSHTVIALHNNTNKSFNIYSYKKGGSEAVNAKQVYINPFMDTDDFIFTTSTEIFNALKAQNINVVLQDNEKVLNDGSLSYYYRNKIKPYINIECEHGHYDEQLRLMNIVFRLVHSVKKQTNN